MFFVLSQMTGAKIVERILPFSDFVAAHRFSERGHARGKTVLRIR
jgi:hypothetical protein